MKLLSWVAIGATNSFILEFEANNTHVIEQWTPSVDGVGIACVQPLALSSEQYAALSPNNADDLENIDMVIVNMIQGMRNSIDSIATNLPE